MLINSAKSRSSSSFLSLGLCTDSSASIAEETESDSSEHPSPAPHFAADRHSSNSNFSGGHAGGVPRAGNLSDCYFDSSDGSSK